VTPANASLRTQAPAGRPREQAQSTSESFFEPMPWRRR
jgi:hypothetical protein